MSADLSKAGADGVEKSNIDKNIIPQLKEKTTGLSGATDSHGHADTESHSHALDGSQYLGIIEEQVYSEQPPTPEEQKPWRMFHPQAGNGLTTEEKPTPHEPSTLSVGPR